MRESKRISCSQETKKIRKILNEEIRLGIHPSSDSETEEVDLQKDLHPLGYYINNREEMIEQMFSIIKGDKLNSMIPPILQDTPLDELKADCLIHLLGMSKKRIFSILEGREINSSSGSETNSDNPSPRRGAKATVKPIIIKQEGCSDISDNSEEVILVDPDLVQAKPSRSKSLKKSIRGSSSLQNHHKKDIQHKRKKYSDDQTKSKRFSEFDSEDAEISEDSHESSLKNVGNNKKVNAEGKTLLDILELEMRARAIKALLNKNESTEVDESTNEAEMRTKSSSPPAVEAEKNNVKEAPIKKLRKKKRKNDDVIVITPKVITIDLTDESDIYSMRKKPKESTLVKKPIGSDQCTVFDNTAIGTSSTPVAETTSRLDLTDVDKILSLADKEINQEHNLNPGTSQEQSLQSSNLDNPENQEKSLQQKRNWAQRWLESKEVKRVVSTSKICGNIRKRIKIAKLAKQSQESEGKVEKSGELQDIQGSVDEYQSLPKSNSTDNPSPVCNKENKKEAESSEQVQDISSTKIELSKDSIDCKENPDNGYNNDLNDDSNSDLTRQNDETDSKQMSSEELENDEVVSSPISSNLNNLMIKKDAINYLTLKKNVDTPLVTCSLKKNVDTPLVTCSLSNSTEVIDNQPDVRVELCSETNTNDFVMSSTIDISINSVNECSGKDLNDTSNNIKSLSDIEVSKINQRKYQMKTPRQNIELEALEIEITDEDRNIDGISDEK